MTSHFDPETEIINLRFELRKTQRILQMLMQHSLFGLSSEEIQTIRLEAQKDISDYYPQIQIHWP